MVMELILHGCLRFYPKNCIEPLEHTRRDLWVELVVNPEHLECSLKTETKQKFLTEHKLGDRKHYAKILH